MTITTTNTNNSPRGAFIALEGLDRSGKTTQVRLLESRLAAQGQAVAVMRFPDRTTSIGRMIDSYLKSNIDIDDHAIHLLFSANRWEAAQKITSLLAAGTTILCDRYYYSGIVYSAAKQNPSLSLTWARYPDIGLPRPDLVIFLDLDAAQARQRGGFGEEVYEKSDMQARVRQLFHNLAAGTDPALHEEAQDLRVVDAGAEVDAVAARIWEVVQPCLAEVVAADALPVRTVS